MTMDINFFLNEVNFEDTIHGMIQYHYLYDDFFICLLVSVAIRVNSLFRHR